MEHTNPAALSDAELIKAYVASDASADDPQVVALIEELKQRGLLR